MHTIRPVLWKHKPNKQGLFPLMIAVTIKRKITYFKTTFRLKESQWNGEIINYTNANLANATVRKQISDLEKIILERGMGEEITAKSLKFKTTVSFSEFAKDVKGDTRPNRKEIKRIVTFNSGDPAIADIDTNFLRRFEKSERARGMSPNTINTTFKWLRRIINQGISENKIKVNPFNGYIFPKYVQTDRVYLTIKEVDKIEDLIKKDIPKNIYNTAVYYLFGCYTGLRFSDWLRFDLEKHVVNDRVILRAKKNHNLVSIKIFTRLQAVLTLMKGMEKPHSLEKTNFYLKDMAAQAKINKNITCHTSRHTNATLLATMGVSSDTASELLGVDRRTIQIYYKITGAKVDKETEVMNRL